MDIGQITVREILENQLGEEKAGRALRGINDAYQNGKRGDELRQHFKDAIKKEGLDPDDLKLAVSYMLPTF